MSQRQVGQLVAMVFLVLLGATAAKFGVATLYATSSPGAQRLLGSEDGDSEKHQYMERRADIITTDGVLIATSVWSHDIAATTTTTTQQIESETDTNGTPAASTASQTTEPNASEDEDSSPDGDGRWVRQYPGGSLYAGVLGYDTPLGADAGLERTRQGDLVNNDRGKISETDSNPAPLELTISAQTQTAADQALGEHFGAVVVMEAETGKIRALVSHPSFDPRPLASNARIKNPETGELIAESSLAREELLADPDRPLQDRTFGRAAPPGSVLKPLWVAAALDSGVVEADEEFPDAAEAAIPGVAAPVQNYGGSSCGGSLAVTLARSCNTSIVDVILRVPVDEVLLAAARAGFNSPLPFELDTIQSAFPGPEVLSGPSLTNPQQGVAYSALGGFEVRVTPLHVANIFAAIANDGRMPSPIVVESDSEETWSENIMSPESARFLRQALQLTVTDSRGTARRLADQGVPVAVKTGTPDSVYGGRTYAWAAMFTIDEETPLVAVALIESPEGESLSGGADAVPVAFDALQAEASAQLSRRLLETAG